MLIYYSFWNEFILKYDNEQHIFDYSIALNEFHKIQINNEWSTSILQSFFNEAIQKNKLYLCLISIEQCLMSRTRTTRDIKRKY